MLNQQSYPGTQGIYFRNTAFWMSKKADGVRYILEIKQLKLTKNVSLFIYLFLPFCLFLYFLEVSFTLSSKGGISLFPIGLCRFPGLKLVKRKWRELYIAEIPEVNHQGLRQ